MSATGRRAQEGCCLRDDDHICSQLLDLEQQWQHIAKSYEFIETLERFVLTSHSLPPEVEKLPKDFPPE